MLRLGAGHRNAGYLDAGTEPLLHYYRAYFAHHLGQTETVRSHLTAAAIANPDYCFPARLDEIHILESAIRSNPADTYAPYYLGNIFYDRQRFADAIPMWERSVQLNPNFSTAWRNLGIAYFNIAKDSGKALAAYDAARKGGL